jgi:Zn-dependent protease
LMEAVLLGVATAALFFLCVVVHAGAHLVVARLFRHTTYASRLFVFGDVPTTGTHGDIAIALAGPAASAILGAGLLLLASPASPEGAANIFKTLAFLSFGLAAINLFPGLPLDGGHVLVSITGRRVRFAVFIGRLCGLAAVVGGVWLVATAPSVIEDTAFGLWLLLAGIFVLSEARATERAAPARPDLEGHTVGAWARPFVGRLDAADPVPDGGGPYAVSDGGRLAGVLAQGRVTAGARTGDLMVPWSSDLGMRTDTPLSTAVERLAKGDATLIVVVDERGVVRGVLDEHSIRENVGSN